MSTDLNLETLKADLSASLKSGDSFRAGLLRMVISQIHNMEIEKKGSGQEDSLSENEIISVLKKEAKKRREAADLYKKGGREELAENEEKELAIIEEYLPPAPTAEEIDRAIEEVRSHGAEDFPSVMKGVMAKMENADGGEVARRVKKFLDN